MANKYLFKIGTQLRVVQSKKMESFSFAEAIAIGIASHQEQRRQLVRDAIEGDRYFYGRKVVDALEISLNKLQETFPEIRQQIEMLTHGHLYRFMN